MTDYPYDVPVTLTTNPVEGEVFHTLGFNSIAPLNTQVKRGKLMKNKKNIFLLFSFLFAGAASAGQYNEGGYITQVKVNIQGHICNIMLSKSVEGGNIQGGEWRCDSYMGQNLLGTAKMAKALGLKVVVTFEGNGAYYKPVYSIDIR
ncbi:hypothetical protein JBO38_21805 [Enterobacter asburiae]|uniref:hypothetical protein n=1 Tax=Enterobacter asburiae TaxID=61645 RepID=UPI00192A7B7E|nr:hypothetical protein [Enterobacter asburiae]MBL5950359.1 hypothetical protein [Enterobacter asburiae]